MEIHGSYKVKYRPQGAEEGEELEVDFTPPFKRIPMLAELSNKLGVKFPDPDKMDSPGNEKVSFNVAVD